MSERSDRSAFLALKQTIDALAAMPEIGLSSRENSFGKQLAFLPLESWPPSFFHRAWHLLREQTEALQKLGIKSEDLPEPPRFPGRDRYISRHPEEGLLLVFPKDSKEVREALRFLPAEYRPDPAPHWIVYPVQGTGKALLDLAHRYHFDLAPDVPEYAQACDLHPLPLLSRRISLSVGPTGDVEGFDLYFPKAAQVLEQVKEEIPDRSFHDAPGPHWHAPATPYVAQALLQIALQHQFSIDSVAIPLLQQLNEEANTLPPRPPVRRVEYDPKGWFWLYFPWNQAHLRDARGIAGAKFEDKEHGPRWGVPRRNAKGLRELKAFLQRYPEFACEVSVRGALERFNKEIEQQVQASRSQEAELFLPGLGGELRPFQKACVHYAIQAQYKVLIGDDVGLGKTPEALAILLHAKAFPALILVPAHLKYNWKRETEHWLPGYSIRVLDGEESHPDDYGADITIVNYDLLTPRLSALQSAFQRRGGIKGIVTDESHYIKEENAQRTKAALVLAEGVPVRLALSGTALPNRPIEIVSQLIFLDQLAEVSGSFWGFVKRYCNAQLTTHGWDFNGNSNELELHEQLRAVCYIRRMRDDVLPELPPIQRHMVPVEIDNREEYERAERELIAWLREQVQQDTQFLATLGNLSEDERKREISLRADNIEQRARRAEELRRIEILKQLSARGKLHAIYPFIEDILATGEKLVVYASHIEIQHKLVEQFPDAAVILGDTSAKKRDKNAQRFQEDPHCPLIICSLQAAKEGLTLTAANKIAIIELGWNPSALEQPEGRIRRMTQTATTLAAYYLLARDTIEPDILRLIEEKQQVIDAVSDGKEPMKHESVLGSLLKHLVL